MNDVKNDILADAIEAYIEAEIKISKLNIMLVILSTVCIIEALLLVLR